MRDVAGRLVVTGEFREGRGEVLISILIPSPPGLTGTHFVHIEAVGRCDPPDFLTVGGDFNPTNKQHGRQNPDGPHVGDPPNVPFTSGLTTYKTCAPGATLGPGPASLLGPNRAALVMFSGEDDQLTQPDGNSWSRIACGVLTPVPPPGAVAPAKPMVPTPLTSPAAAQPPPGQPAPGQPAPGQAAPAQPAQRQPAPGQPAANQPAPGQPPAAKPASSPVPAQAVVPRPVFSPSAAAVVAASPVAIVAVPASAPPVAAGATQTSGGSIGTGLALLIAVHGVGLIGAGYLLDGARGARGAGSAVRGALSWSSASGSQGTPCSSSQTAMASRSRGSPENKSAGRNASR